MQNTKKKLLSFDGLHKIYFGIFEILDQLFDLKIITAGKRKDIKYKVKYMRYKRLILRSIVHYPGLYGYLKKERPDIVHLRSYYRPYSIISLFYTIIHRKEFIISEEQRNGSRTVIEKILFRLLLLWLVPLINAKAKKIICVTRDAQKYLKGKCFKNLVFIPIPYTVKAKPEDIDNEGKKLKIITVARYDWLKAHNILIEAVRYLLDEGKIKRGDIEVHLVGKGGLLESETEQLVADYKLGDVVKFIGYVDNKKLDQYYREHNLFVLPSRSEPVGMVVLEAMSNGLPVIVSSSTGIKCSVQQGRNGYIFETDNHEDLAKKIALMRSSRLRQSFGIHSLNIVKQRHDPERIKELYRKAFC